MNTSLPTPIELGVKRRIQGAKDSHGKKIVTYGDPLPWPVSGLAPGANAEPNNPNRDLSLILWTVYSPEHCNQPTELDRVLVNGVEYAVEARPADWSQGPWGYAAGVVTELKRAEG